MKPADFPVFVAAFDLARDLTLRAAAWPGPVGSLLAPAVVDGARAVVADAAVALRFPAHRAAAIDRADVGLARLRVELRLCHAVGLLGDGAMTALGDRIAEVGRMLGGWRKRAQT